MFLKQLLLSKLSKPITQSGAPGESLETTVKNVINQAGNAVIATL